MTTKAQPMTAEQLLDMPDDGFRYELVRGELRKMVPAGYDHSKIAGRIALRLGAYVVDVGLGEVCVAEPGFKLASNPDHVRVPDAAFVRRERDEAAGPTPGFFSGPPDIAVEVISPSDRYADVEEKTRDYLSAGTLAVIVVDPRRRTVTVHRPDSDPDMLTEADTLAVEDIIPGWRMPVRGIFE